MTGALGFMLSWIDQIKREGSVASEYALAVELVVIDHPVAFVQYGAGSFEESYGSTLPAGNHVFPVMSIGPSDEFPHHLERFDEDLWNLAGHHQPSRPTFSLR
jgi:hypothetical protein